MCKLFDDWAIQIKDYCENNGLDFEKAKKLSQCWGREFLALQFHDPLKNDGRGLLDETPMPLVLLIKKTDTGLVFEQTEHTQKYLGKAS